MILVRMVFQARFGKAGEVAAGMVKGQELARQVLGDRARARILTDLSGQFDTVVQELEVESQGSGKVSGRAGRGETGRDGMR